MQHIFPISNLTFAIRSRWLYNIPYNPIVTFAQTATNVCSSTYSHVFLNIYYILTLDRAVNQRCARVNKQKKKRKQVGVMKEYRQVPAAVESVGTRKARVRVSLLTEECGPQQPPVDQPQLRCRRSAKCVLEDNIVCYGQEKKLGQYSSLSLSPLISHTPQTHEPFRE